jgi:hypothetical protein
MSSRTACGWLTVACMRLPLRWPSWADQRRALSLQRARRSDRRRRWPCSRCAPCRWRNLDGRRGCVQWRRVDTGNRPAWRIRRRCCAKPVLRLPGHCQPSRGACTRPHQVSSSTTTMSSSPTTMRASSRRSSRTGPCVMRRPFTSVPKTARPEPYAGSFRTLADTGECPGRR